MNGVDVTGAVFCFAAEYIRKLSNTDMLKMIVMNMPGEKSLLAFLSFNYIFHVFHTTPLIHEQSQTFYLLSKQDEVSFP